MASLRLGIGLGCAGIRPGGGTNPLQASLINSWSFESDGSSDVDGGQAWTQEGTPNHPAGHVGNCAALKNAPAVYTMIIANADAGDLQPGEGTLSFSYWLYIDSYPGSFNDIIRFGGNAAGTPGWAMVYRSTGIIRMYLSEGTTRIDFDSGTHPGQDTWFHIMGEINREDDTARMWINNGTAATLDISTHTSITATVDATLARGYLNFSNHRMDQFMIFNEPLNSDRRAFLYNSGTGRSYADLTSYSGS